MGRSAAARLGAVVVWLAALSCKESTGPATPATVTVQLSGSVEQGDTASAKATVLDKNGAELPDARITWSSTNTVVASVNSAGVVTGLGPGTANIRAVASGIEGLVAVTVTLTVQTVSVAMASANIDMADSALATPTAMNPKNVVVNGRTATYETSDAAVATVSPAGYVRGVSLGTATISATVDGKTGSTPVTVVQRPAGIVIDQVNPTLAVSASLQLTAAVKDSNGATMSGRTITWSSSDAQRIAVSSGGNATWRAPGPATITARSGSASATTTVTGTGDFAIRSVIVTQGVQDSIGSIPLVTNGQPAAVLVMITSPAHTTLPMQVRLRVTKADNSLAFADSVTVSDLDVDASLMFPTARFFLPVQQIKAGYKWQVSRDPSGATPDDSAANDVFPRAGPATMSTFDVPPVNVRFVPITLAANGNTTPTITDIPTYTSVLEAVHPVAQINTSIGSAFATSTSFGSPPTGGAINFWQSVLQELDAARVAAVGAGADPTTHWYGVVGPPSGFTFTTYGGIAYRPIDYTPGANKRTAMGIRTGWFNNQTQAQSLVAHELGHNFGRQHAPCGGAAGPDAFYPQANGSIGLTQHNVWLWNQAPTQSLTAMSGTGTFDLMGYCFPIWSSAYTYKGVMDFRGPAPLVGVGGSASANVVASPAADVVVFQGSVHIDGRGAPELLPALRFRGATASPATGNYRFQGFDAAGQLVLDERFEPVPLEDIPGLAHFTFSLPADGVASRVVRVRVTGPTGAAELVDVADAGTPVTRRLANGRVQFGCGNANTRLAIQDDDTGQLLGISRGDIEFATSAAHVSVSCSRGVRTTRRALQLR